MKALWLRKFVLVVEKKKMSRIAESVKTVTTCFHYVHETDVLFSTGERSKCSICKSSLK
jgi:hypothetical protein